MTHVCIENLTNYQFKKQIKNLDPEYRIASMRVYISLLNELRKYGESCGFNPDIYEGVNEVFEKLNRVVSCCGCGEPGIIVVGRLQEVIHYSDE